MWPFSMCNNNKGCDNKNNCDSNNNNKPGLRGKSKSMTWSTAGISNPLAAISVHTYINRNGVTLSMRVDDRNSRERFRVMMKKEK